MIMFIYISMFSVSMFKETSVLVQGYVYEARK